MHCHGNPCDGYSFTYGIVSTKRDLMHVFSRFQFFFYILEVCFLRTENRSICHGVEGSEFLISHTFQRKCYISIVRTGNFIMCVCLVPSRGNDPLYDIFRHGDCDIITLRALYNIHVLITVY